MSDRLTEIRARLDAATPGPLDRYVRFAVDFSQRMEAMQRIVNARIVWAFAMTPEEYEERLRVVGVIGDE